MRAPMEQFLTSHPHHNSAELLSILRGLTPFAPFTDEELSYLLPFCHIINLAEQDELIREGEPSDNKAYFLLTGEVSVYVNGKFILTLRRPGDIVGEMSLVSDEPRSATVRANMPSRFLMMAPPLGPAENDNETLQSYRLRYYFSRMFSNILTEKLRITSDRAKMYEDALLKIHEAEAANLAKTQFLSAMSHELRTPLNSILGFAQLMTADSEIKKDPVQSEYVEYILKGGQHLLSLINEVLDLAKVESGHMAVSMASAPLGVLVEETLTFVQPMAQKQGISLLNDLRPDQPIWVMADYGRLRQILLNFLSNAIKYNKEKGSVTVRVRLGPSGTARLCVTDTGLGIPSDKLPGMFQPFNRLGMESSAIEGTGIGLAISKKITELMGGTMGVESEEGQGSTFWVEFPLAESPSMDGLPGSPDAGTR
ncbi:MAG: ATP-binding protein [Deltaproteobacteria bacterium]|nr:ATP-binding protein [Deltaproteobacteria bacterium]